jgi:catechol 2,3-dioxygenase
VSGGARVAADEVPGVGRREGKGSAKPAPLLTRFDGGNPIGDAGSIIGKQSQAKNLAFAAPAKRNQGASMSILGNCQQEPIGKQMKDTKPIAPGVSIGHVHLKVADLERALRFYCGVLGFELTQRFGRQAAFLSAGGYHHHIGLNTWESGGGSPPPPGATGLYHLAILYPTRAALADALRRLIEAGIPLEGAADHGVSEAIYLRDPDGNGVELYRDRPKEQWPRTPDGGLAMFTHPLDSDSLLREADGEVSKAHP